MFTIILTILLFCLWISCGILIIYECCTFASNITDNKLTMNFIVKETKKLAICNLLFCLFFSLMFGFKGFTLFMLFTISLTECIVFFSILYYYYDKSCKYANKQNFNTRVSFEDWKKIVDTTPDRFSLRYQEDRYSNNWEFIVSNYKTSSYDTVYFSFNTVIDFLKFVLYVNEIKLKQTKNKEQNAMSLIKQTIESEQKH